MLTARHWSLFVLVHAYLRSAVGLMTARQDPEDLEAEPDAPPARAFTWDDHLDESRLLYTDKAPPVLATSFARKSRSHVARRRELGLRIEKNETTEKEIRQYAREYFEEFQGRQLIYLLHVSKTAGTFFCECAKERSHCLTPSHLKQVILPGQKHPFDLNSNCLQDGVGTISDGPRLGFHDPLFPSHPRPQDLRQCSNAALAYQTHALDFIANENTLLDDGPCRQFWNLVVVRNPVNRLISHIAHLGGMPYHPEFKSAGIKPETVLALAPRLADNYYIRSLAGAHVYELPLGNITQAHLQEAKARLEEFDTLIVRDETKENLAMIANRELGMSCEDRVVAVDKYASAADEYNAALEKQWTEGDWNKIRAQNSYDIELFKHAQRLRQLDRLVFEHKAFRGMMRLQLSKRADESPCGFMATKKARSGEEDFSSANETGEGDRWRALAESFKTQIELATTSKAGDSWLVKRQIALAVAGNGQHPPHPTPPAAIDDGRP